MIGKALDLVVAIGVGWLTAGIAALALFEGTDRGIPHWLIDKWPGVLFIPGAATSDSLLELANVLGDIAGVVVAIAIFIVLYARRRRGTRNLGAKGEEVS